MLHGGTYRIDLVLGSGGFGITYLATDVTLDMRVAIKEFFPKDFCTRDGDTSHVTLGNDSNHDFMIRLKQKFLKEARNIAKLHHPGIIRILSAFEENGTSYYVMDYIEGSTLYDIVHRNGRLSVPKALEYISKVGDALGYVHSHNMNHLDVKPANIMVRQSDDTPVLIDFGLSKQYDSDGLQTSTTPTGLSHGYAPLEQYKDGGVREFSPHTDIYSLAATLYFILTGMRPPQAPDLIDKALPFPADFPLELRGPIMKAMSTARKDRQSSVAEFINDLNKATKGSWRQAIGNSQRSSSGYGTANAGDLNRDTVIENNGDNPVVLEHKTKRKLRKWWLVGGAAGVVAVIVAICVINSVPSVPVHDPNGYTNGVDYVDLGLSVKWATCNLGASSPEEYGNYYAWGETTPRTGSSGSSWYYDCDTTPYCLDSSGDSWSKYSGSDGKTVLDPSDDAATVALGAPWRMPTLDEIVELKEKCEWTWTKMNGKNGYKVTGPNGNSIFLSAAGRRYGSSLYNPGSYGNYWSSSLNALEPHYACSLDFDSAGYDWYYNYRFLGLSVRPVRP